MLRQHDRRDLRRARRERRRVRRRRGARDGARDGASMSSTRTIVFMAVAGEEQGLLRLDALRRAGQAGRPGTSRAMFTNDIIGSTLGGNGIATRTPCGSSPRACRRTRRRRGEDAARRSAARTTRRRGSWRASSTSRRELRDRHSSDDRSTGATASCRGGDHIPFLERGFRRGALHRAERDFDHQHQNVRVENGDAVRRPAAVRRLRVHGERGAGERRRARRAGVGARAPKDVR